MTIRSNSLTDILGRPSTPPSPEIKKSILCWSDAVAPVCTTGFGVVSKHILKALYSTGRYNIDQLAINYFGDFYDKEEVPYTLVPAKLKDPRDPYGNKMLLSSLDKGNYDYLLVINDPHVTQQAADLIRKIQQKKQAAGKKAFKIVYYYPVDGKLVPGTHALIQIADRSVAYTNYAAEETKNTIGMSPTDVIYHGVDTSVFHPLSTEERAYWREKHLHIVDPDRTIVVAAGRNSRRKDMPKALMAFKEFKKVVPNSGMYCHTQVEDGSDPFQRTDLSRTCTDLGLKPREDILFPQNYAAAQGFPEKVVNQLYNCGDLYLTTALTEGFGLISVEMMACGVPFVGGAHPVNQEIFGKYGDRGFLYPCKEAAWIDNNSFRPLGRLEDIVETMLECHHSKELGVTQARVAKAKEFANTYTWHNIGQEWIKLFGELDDQPDKQPNSLDLVQMEEM
jgi:glycosyltransferase involved in cell wall biosynthesis